MIPMLVIAVLLAIVAGILLKSILRAVLLIALVFGIFFVGCYALDVSPRAMLTEGVRAGAHELKAHRREIREWL